MSAIVELQGIRKSYGLGTPVVTEVLHGIDLTIANGEFAALTGPSGSGKSTLVLDILAAHAARKLNGAKSLPAKHRHIENLDFFEKLVQVDQEPIGRSPRPTPAACNAPPACSWPAGPGPCVSPPAKTPRPIWPKTTPGSSPWVAAPARSWFRA